MPEINFFWDPLSDNILQERDETGAVTAEYTAEPGLYGNVISQNRGGVESQFHYDAQGSTMAVTDDNQNVTDTFAYTAFGEVTERTGTTEVPFQYIGQKGYYRDRLTGHQLIRRRVYGGSAGRWLSVDAALHGFAHTYYVYCNSRPLTQIDPSGLVAEDVCLPCRTGYAIFYDFFAARECKRSIDLFLRNANVRTLLDCAIEYGCLRGTCPIYCWNCSQIAAYHHGFSPLGTGGSHIELCYRKFNALTRKEKLDVFLEELYHALTVCQASFAFPQYDSSMEAFEKELAKVGLQIDSCSRCVALEALAKGCAVTVTDPDKARLPTLLINLWGAITASCDFKCDFNAKFLPGSAEMSALKTWFPTIIPDRCYEINKDCKGSEEEDEEFVD